jgi:hypothetical protein
MDVLPPSVLLEDRHYLGRAHRAKFTYEDKFGVMVFATPSARNLPKDWVELVRWCLVGEVIAARQWDAIDSRHLAGHGDRYNAGSQQWKAAKTWLADKSTATTVVSYSDPSVGHTGALYRACGWLWAPTWIRLFSPPTGNGKWRDGGKAESVKDRWIAILRPDNNRAAALAVSDTRIANMPWAEYREPKWKRGRPQLHTGGGNYQRFTTPRNFYCRCSGAGCERCKL